MPSSAVYYCLVGCVSANLLGAGARRIDWAGTTTSVKSSITNPRTSFREVFDDCPAAILDVPSAKVQEPCPDNTSLIFVQGFAAKVSWCAAFLFGLLIKMPMYDDVCRSSGQFCRTVQTNQLV